MKFTPTQLPPCSIYGPSCITRQAGWRSWSLNATILIYLFFSARIPY